ncbi:hypothetical protein AUP68_07545 [Ilyonectria robusta]
MHSSFHSQGGPPPPPPLAPYPPGQGSGPNAGTVQYQSTQQLNHLNHPSNAPPAQQYAYPAPPPSGAPSTPNFPPHPPPSIPHYSQPTSINNAQIPPGNQTTHPVNHSYGQNYQVPSSYASAAPAYPTSALRPNVSQPQTQQPAYVSTSHQSNPSLGNASTPAWSPHSAAPTQAAQVRPYEIPPVSVPIQQPGNFANPQNYSYSSPTPPPSTQPTQAPAYNIPTQQPYHFFPPPPNLTNSTSPTNPTTPTSSANLPSLLSQSGLKGLSSQVKRIVAPAITSQFQKYRPQRPTAPSSGTLPGNTHPIPATTSAGATTAPASSHFHQESHPALPVNTYAQPSPAAPAPTGTPPYAATAPPSNAYYPPLPAGAPPQQTPAAQHPAAYPSYPPNLNPNRVGEQPPMVTQGPLATVSTQINTLNINARGDHVHQGSNRKLSDDETPRNCPPLRATGPPNDVVSYCSESREVGYSLDWYRLAEVPDYLFCTRCHAENIRGTNLENCFEKITRPDGSVSTCGFWHPRIKEILWPQALQSNDLSALSTFMKKRLTFVACKGRQPRATAEGVKWFKMAGQEIEGFIACEECFESRVVGTSFEPRFQPERKQPDGKSWTCDLTVPFISRAVVKLAKYNDWQGFVASSTRRLKSPVCEGKEIQSNDLTWYRPRNNAHALEICETCYMDTLELTQFGRESGVVGKPSGFNAFMDMLGQKKTCNLPDTNIPIRSALDAAIYRRQFSVFLDAAQAITRLVPCTGNGIIRGNWWTLAGGCDELSVCEACYTGLLYPLGTAPFFEGAKRDPQATIVCSLCIESPRFIQFLNKFLEALDRGVFSYFADHVRMFAGVPACPAIKAPNSSKWWGYGEALFCHDCYLTFVAMTPLAHSLPVKGEYDERAQICQIWSPRMRKLWLEVCAAGPPGSPESEAAIAQFKAVGSKRQKVWIATIPQIEFIQKMQQIKMAKAMHSGLLSVTYQGMDSMAAVNGTTDGYLHGNSSLGWYATEHGATEHHIRHGEITCSQKSSRTINLQLGMVLMPSAVWPRRNQSMQSSNKDHPRTPRKRNQRDQSASRENPRTERSTKIILKRCSWVLLTSNR